MSELEEAIGTAQRRIVDLMKRSGPRTTSELAESLGVTTQAIRPQLAELEERGLVDAEMIVSGARGRPPLGWALSPLAIDLFPDRHSDLTVELIDAMRTALGDDGLEKVLAERDKTQLADFDRHLPSGADVETRVELLARRRTQQGYMAEVVTDGDDLLLVEHHCPVCAAATTCQGLCSNELDLFRSAIGPGATIERTQHLLSGDDRGVYRIRVL